MPSALAGDWPYTERYIRLATCIAGDALSPRMNGTAHANGEAWIPAAGELIATISPRATARQPWETAATAQDPYSEGGERPGVT